MRKISMRGAASLSAPALFLLVSLLAWDASAQSRYVQLVREFDRPRAHHEAVVLPGADSAQVIVTFRIPNSMLVFMQQGARFSAEPEVTVTIYRGDEVVDERLWRGVHEAASFEATQARLRDLEGRVEFGLAPGSYSYELSLNDGASSPRTSARRRSFEVPDFASASAAQPFFGRASRGAGGVRLSPANLSGDVPFGEDVSVFVPVGTFSDLESARYRLYRIASAEHRERRRERRGAREPYEREADDVLVSEGEFDPAASLPAGDASTDCMCWEPAVEVAGSVLVADLPTESLRNGDYLIEIELAGGGASLENQRRFSTLWRDMPLSLYDPEVAIRHLEFIAGNEEVKSMLRGSREDRIERFRSFWERRDPTPGTVFNELMAEYYRRIDAAAQRFQTGTTPYPDGLRTDAARVYIVNGPPDDISSSFPSSGGVEQVWTYPDGSRFVFRAASSLDPLQLHEEQSARGR